MGAPGFAVAFCFATASSAFVVALAYTTVANILLMQAGVPLMPRCSALAAVPRNGGSGDLGGDRGSDMRRRHHGVGIVHRRRVAGR